MTTKFFKCPHCGNVIVKHVDSGVVPHCCGEEMKELSPKGIDGAKEKHVPVVTRIENNMLNIKVGEMPHPMTPEHHIAFVAVETPTSIDVHYLDPAKPAEAVCYDPQEVTAVYEYCNLHGLWMTTEIK